MAGRAESTYRYTVIDTIGGGASEIQKNVIARRGLGPPEELLTCRLRIRGPRPPRRHHRARPRERRPGRAHVALARRLRRDRGEGRTRRRSTAACRSPRRSTRTPATADMQRALFDLKADGRPRRVPAPGGRRRRRDRELPARRRRPARHRVRRRAGGEPGRRLLLDQRLRPGRPVLAVGRPRPQLPRGRRLPRLLGPRRRRRSGAARARPSATAPAAACTR